MATKQFISLENLSVYDSLIKQVISEGDAVSIKAAALNGKKLELYTIENPTAQDQPRFSITLPFTQQEIIGANGKATMFNESDGGGSMFTHNDGSIAYVGTNDGGENGLTGQLYTVKKDANGKNVGTRLNMTLNGFYYTNGANSAAFTADDELATLGDIDVASDDKTVYVTETAGGAGDAHNESLASSPTFIEPLCTSTIPNGAGSLKAVEREPVSSPPTTIAALFAPMHEVSNITAAAKIIIMFFFIRLYNIRILLCLFLPFLNRSKSITYPT